MKTTHTIFILILLAAATSCRSGQNLTIRSETSETLAESADRRRSLTISDSTLLHAVLTIDSAEIILTAPDFDSIMPPHSARIRATGITLDATGVAGTRLQTADSATAVRKTADRTQKESTGSSNTSVSTGLPMLCVIVPAFIILLLAAGNTAFRRQSR